MIDIVCQLRIEVAQRVVRQCGQVNDRLESRKIARRQIAQIFANLSECPNSWLAKVAIRIEIRIEPDDLMPSLRGEPVPQPRRCIPDDQ